jgi:hypothetical protein
LNTPASPTITIGTANWGGYWEKYGDCWTQAVLELNPTRVVIASDVPIKTDFDVVLCNIHSLGPMRNAAIEITDTEWFVPSDLDDIPLKGYIDDIGQDCEIHAFSCLMSDHVYSGNPHAWDSAFSEGAVNPLVSCSAYKTDWAKRVKYRQIGWEDWAFWLDMKKAGARVYWDQRCRYIYTRPTGSLSRQDISRKEKEIADLKRAGW